MRVPPELLSGPFTLADARRAGLTRYQLRGPLWRRLFRDVYAPADLPDGPPLRASAAALLLPPGGVLTGSTAAWVYGLDVCGSASPPLEVLVGRDQLMRPRPGMVVRHGLLAPGDVQVVGGLRVTSPVRTCFDLARRPPLVDAVVATDAFLHSGAVTLAALDAYAARCRGWRGVRQIARVAELAEPLAESPMETRLRLVVVLGGLPRPAAQVQVHDGAGLFVARVDLGYVLARLALEYDGGIHFTARQAVADRRRRNALEDAGWSVRQYTAADVYRRSSLIVQQVDRHLRSAA